MGLAAALPACGGGGGGGSDSVVDDGGFTLAATSAAFSATQNGAAPAPREIAVTVTGAKVAYVGAAYLPGQTPAAWLGIDVVGSGRSYRLVLSVLTTSLAPGDYSATFAVGTADSAGKVLRQQNVTVAYSVGGRLALTAATGTAAFVFGDTRTTQDVALTVQAPGEEWTLSSDADWLRVPTATGSGSRTVTASIDAGALTPGAYTATVRVVSDASAANAASVDLAVVVTAPVFTVVEESVVLGGPDGRSEVLQQDLRFSLSTGSGLHPYAVTVRTDDGGDWLDVDTAKGFVGSGGARVTLAASRAGLTGGTRTAEVEVSTTVKGMTFSEVRPVTFNTEASRLVTTAAGVGFSRVPGRDVLTRRVKVLSSLGRTDVPWTAASSQPWLTVTARGTTGDDIVLSADPAGLAGNSMHYADVTVVSPDERVENSQSIRVGLRLSSTPPAKVVVQAGVAFLAANPVEPLVATSDAVAGTVTLYDVHTGAVARTWQNVVARAGAMTWSGDGRTLYVHDRTNLQVVAVSLLTGAHTATYPATAGPNGTSGSAVAYLRPAGYPMLVTPGSRVFDLTTNTERPAPTFTVAGAAVSLDVAPDQTLVVADFGVTQRLERSALYGGRLVVTEGAGFATAQGRAGEACVAAAGDRIYTASGYPYEFPATDVATGTVVQRLPGSNYPNAVRCVWNGLVVGGIDGYYAPTDIWVYDGPSGALLAQLDSTDTVGAYRSLVDRGLAVSADGARLVSAASPNGQSSTTLLFQDLPPPP